MYTLSCHIEVGDLIFDQVHQVEITSSWRNLTDTARIVLPRNVKLQSGSLKDMIRRGMPVLIRLGWDNDLQTEFTGYVSAVKPEAPFVIEAEDEMWKLKQKSVNMSWKNATLKGILSDILPSGMSTQINDMTLGPFRADNTTVSKLLHELRGLGIQTFFQNGTLYSGLAYSLRAELPTIGVDLLSIVSDNLEYRLKEDVKIKIEAESIFADGSKKEVSLGDEDGEVHTLHFYEVPQADLKARAEDELKRAQYEGYRGSFTHFGVPFIQHGYKVALTNSRYPDREGTYFVDETKVSFGTGGFRREIHPGPRAA